MCPKYSIYFYLSQISLYQEDDPTCFLLESLGEESHVSRYSLVGFDPSQILTARNNTLIIHDTAKGLSDEYECENPYLALRKVVPQNIISKKYAGGLTGFLSYDAILRMY